MSTTRRVAILYGGRSVEHEISINSARNIAEFIDKSLFEPLHIGISREGNWFLTEGVTDAIEQGEALHLDLSSRPRQFRTPSGRTISPDMFFPVLHGTDGEDGSIQGMLQALELPFVGSGVLGSSLSMNKLYAKKLMETVNVPVGAFVSYTSDERGDIDFDRIAKKLGIPFMAKAANLGSSVGVFKVDGREKFNQAVEEVFTYDNTLICEEFVDGRELECALIGNDENVQASLPGEIVVSDNYEFYTYEAKYLDPEAAKIVVPAEIPDDISDQIRELSIRTYKILHCQDFARVDLFLSHDGRILINEINTIPGFTNSSMFPMMWQERGISFTDLITKLIRLAGDRYKKESHIITSRKG